MNPQSLTRRGFLAAAAAAPFALAAKNLPVGLELYSVRDEMTKDMPATVRAVGKMGYQVVEFYSPYLQWTPEVVKDARTAEMSAEALEDVIRHGGRVVEKRSAK